MGDNTKMEIRYAEFCALRQSGTDRVSAARQLGLSDTTGRRYERAYQKVTDLGTLRRRTDYRIPGTYR